MRPQSASLRTTLAISALTLISDLFTSLPAALVDPLVEPFLTHVLSMSGMTKKIVATASQHTATVVLTHAPFHPRAVHLVAQLGSEKTPQARLFGAQHVLTLLRVHGTNPALSSSASASSASSASASAGPSAADELERAVSRALADPNAQVREQAREAYWELVRLGGPWTERAERVRALLDTTAKKLLDKARPAEVSAPAQQAAAAGASTAAGGSARRAGPGAAAGARRTGAAGPSGGGAGPSPAAGVGAGPKKMSVKDMLAAKRREALAAKERGDGGDLLDEGVVLTPTRRSLARDGAVESSPAESATLQETPTRPQAAQHSPPASPSPAAAAAAAARPPAFASPPPHTPARPSPASASASRSLVPDHVVDDALREQALQAEQAAERLLELAEDEADAASAPAPSTSSSSAPPAASTPARAPPSTAAAADPAAGAALRTPAPNPALRRLNGAGAASSVFADSPDARDPLGAATSGSWWLKRGEALGAPSSSSSSAAPAREPDSAARREEIDALVERVARCGSGRDGGEVDAAGWREVGRLARERPVRDGEGGEAGEGAAEDGENARFWRDEARFERVFEGVRGFLLREQGAAQVLLLLSLTHFSSFPRPRLCEPR